MAVSAVRKSQHYKYDGKDGFEALCRVVWTPNDPDNIRFYVSADEFTDENGEKPGMWLTFSSKMKSANYDPGYFNRAARWLKLHDLPHPPTVEVRSRKLADRIAWLLR